MTKTLTWVIALGLVGTASFAQARSEIQSVSHTTGAGGSHSIVVKGNELSKPTIITITARNTTIIEFNAYLRTERGRIDIQDSGVSYVQYGWYSAKPPKVRFAFRLTGSFAPKIESTNGGWTINFGGTTATSVAAPTPKVTVTPAQKINGPTAPKLPDGEALPMPGEKGAPTPVAGSPLAQVQANQATIWGDSKPEQKVETITNTQNVAKPAAFVAGTPAAQMVSLDFVGTDIIQIMKALSIQSGVNIVTSPDVSPADKPVRVTISLNKVTLDEALTYVTAIANLRFAKVSNTYIVTPAENFSQAMRQVMERMGGRYETRVVNLVSGQAQKIKEAVEKSISPAGQKGFYEVIVPTAADLPGVALSPIPAADAGDGKGGTAAPATTAPAKSTGRVYYLMVVGDPARVTEVETYIRDLDAKIADSSSFNRQADMSTVVIPVQSGETGRIKLMIDRLVAEHPRAAEFSIQESTLEGTTKGEAMTMTLLMIGPKEEVGKLESFAKTLDKELCAVMGKSYEADLAGLEKIWEVVDLNYSEPTLIELDLKSRFKGLQVSLMPNPVTPGAKGSTTATQSQSGSTGAGASAAGSTSTETKTETKDVTGHEPMRIVLRGTRAQIDEAKDYLAMVDVAPRQIALELRVMELSQEEAMKIGIDWNLITGGRLNPFRMNQSAGDTAATPGTFSGGIQFNATDSATVLASLDKLNGGRNLIARPNALVSDGRATNLFVGDTIRYVKSIQSTQNGTTVETDEVKVGVSFDIAARVGGAGQIALDLSQNFNILTGFTPVPGGGNLPQTSDRLTNMFVNMQSGETLAIGGLILEQDRKTVSGVPLLKDLPIIGALFRRSSTSKSKTEIVFFLTAHEVNESNRSNAASPRNSENKTPNPLGDYQRSRAPKGGKDGKSLR
ncbi:MAG: hypothetical protein ACKVQS_13275 [Fimbriimonadaceae bacterium]